MSVEAEVAKHGVERWHAAIGDPGWSTVRAIETVGTVPILGRLIAGSPMRSLESVKVIGADALGELVASPASLHTLSVSAKLHQEIPEVSGLPRLHTLELLISSNRKTVLLDSVKNQVAGLGVIQRLRHFSIHCYRVDGLVSESLALFRSLPPSLSVLSVRDNTESRVDVHHDGGLTLRLDEIRVESAAADLETLDPKTLPWLRIELTGRDGTEASFKLSDEKRRSSLARLKAATSRFTRVELPAK